MWNKISNALKRQDDTDAGSTFQGQHHPNASTRSLASTAEAPFPIPSPPSSPSKHGRRNMFKRMSRTTNHDDGDTTSSPFKLPIGLPKRVKSHLNLNGNSSQLSLARGSTDTRPSQDTLRSYQETIPRESQDSLRSPAGPDYGSMRSILRDPKTPGTGQNVRFFSRDAYKVISPDQSMESQATPEPISFLERLQNVPVSEQPEPHPHRKRPSVTEIFAPVNQTQVNDTSKNLASLMMPIPPPDLSNIFDMSRDGELPNIPVGFDIPMLDSAVEMADGEGHGFTSTPHKDYEEQTVFHSMGLSDVAEDEKENSELISFAPTPPPSGRDHDRSHSFSFGQTVFHSLARSSASSSEKSRLSDSSSIFKSRSRALSDGVFQRGSMTSPEADINDDSGAELVVYAGPPTEPPDPFRANATTYYTPQTMIPPTPPQNSTHSRKSSKEDDVNWSLRTQLALQQELCAQYEIDLGARDELVQSLTERCEKVEKEGERRRGVLRTWKKKVGELERACRGLEEEVSRGREESFERSVMDEASGEALKCLQRRIGTLEREKAEEEKKTKTILEQKEALEKQVARLEIQTSASKEHTHVDDSSSNIAELKSLVVNTEQASVAERERHRIAEFEWLEERALLISRGAQVETSREELSVELSAAQEQLKQKDNEYGVLKSELEAQWKHTESTSEKMQEVQQERDALKGDIVILKEEIEGFERRVGEMAVEWNESESRRTELEAEIQETLDVKEVIEKQKEDLEEQLREERELNAELSQALDERDIRVTELNSEREYANDNAERLEENIRQRDAEIAEYSQRVVEREIAAEQLREQMNNMKREHSHLVDDQARKLNEIAGSDVDTRQQMEDMVKAKAETDMVIGTLKDRVSALKDEVERLRRQVHELQQESADKEVKIVQLTKQKSQDKEDVQGLNIALDSKQQELELLKRKLGVKGTAGSTPGQPSKIHRRESSMFVTPGMSRPPSALSDTGKDNVRTLDTPTTSKTFGKSIRTNAATPTSTKSATGSMGPPPPKVNRSSIGTPTPSSTRLSSALARSSSAKPSSTPGTPSIHRRASSTALEQARAKMSASGRRLSDAPSELDEKENIETPAPTKVKRRASAMLVAA